MSAIANELSESMAKTKLDDKPKFIKSETFDGAKPGYKFQKGGEGVGYYIDVIPTPTEVKIEKTPLEKIMESFDDEKKGNVTKFIRWAQETWLVSEELANTIKTKCENKEAKDRQEIIQDIFKEGYNKEWIKTVESDLDVSEYSAEKRLTFALDKYVNGGRDMELIKLYRSFRKVEEQTFYIGIYGKEGYMKQEEKSKQVETYAMEVQKKFVKFLDSEDGIEKLNAEAQKLMPAYIEVRDKIQSKELDPATMDVESLKPMIEFQILESIMQQLMGGGGHGHSHGGKPCGGHGHAHEGGHSHASHGHSHGGKPCDGNH